MSKNTFDTALGIETIHAWTPTLTRSQLQIPANPVPVISIKVVSSVILPTIAPTGSRRADLGSTCGALTFIGI
jgi:hypothetical protein